MTFSPSQPVHLSHPGRVKCAGSAGSLGGRGMPRSVEQGNSRNLKVRGTNFIRIPDVIIDKSMLIRLTHLARDHARKSNVPRAKASLGTLRKEPSAAQEHNNRCRARYCAG
ncbi:hypothetical protein [Verrucomicrobium spinosum]|nr:hypothetical protein [Verrucomicrobium spinosum]